MPDKNRKLNKKMLERLIIIHNLIKSGVSPTAEQIQRYYCEQTGYSKVGIATIYRDISTLQVQFQAPLYFDRSTNGYRYLDDNWNFALNSITEQDVFYLSTAKTILNNLSDSPLYNGISEAIDFLTDTQTNGKSEFINRIAVCPAPKVIVNPEIWDKIMNSLKNNKIIEFDYNGRWYKGDYKRRVHPWQLVLDNSMYYIFGWDETADNRKGGERLFCLNRIKDLQITKDTFILPDNFDFSKRCSGGRFGAYSNQCAETFKIEFSGKARQYVNDYIWAENQKIIEDEEKDTSTISFSCSQYHKVLEWILSLGADAKPLAPESLVEEWKNEISRMYQMLHN